MTNLNALVRTASATAGSADSQDDVPTPKLRHKCDPVWGAARGVRLRSRSAAFSAAVSAGVLGAVFFFITASISAFVGGFGAVLLVWVSIRPTLPLSTLLPFTWGPTPVANDHPQARGVAAPALAV